MQPRHGLIPIHQQIPGPRHKYYTHLLRAGLHFDTGGRRFRRPRLFRCTDIMSDR
jgi:hypothetical protein